MPSSSRDPMVGRLVAGRFHVKRLLATGGMARVYVARDGEGGPRIALKILGEGAEPRLVALMEREGAALAELDHPSIVRGIAHGPLEQGGYFVAMELVEGESITRWIRRHDPALGRRLGLMRQLLDALEAVHGAGLVHRDLKASNVLVRGEPGREALVLIDFGVVQRDGDERPGDEHLLGGVHTSAPEQIRGGRVDARTDLYAFGVLLFRVVAGRYPFHSKVSAEVLGLHLHGEIPSLPESTPSFLDAVVAGCLAKAPAERFADVTAVRNALAAAGPLGGTKSERPLNPAWIVGGLLLLGALALGYLFAG